MTRKCQENQQELSQVHRALNSKEIKLTLTRTTWYLHYRTIARSLHRDDLQRGVFTTLDPQEEANYPLATHVENFFPKVAIFPRFQVYLNTT